MNESSKTTKVRPQGFAETYLTGRIIDIGAGADPVCPWAEAFDLQHGDANTISRYREAEAYDTVHSSHCLEHMHDPRAALAEWWSLVKPGGHLIVVVPEEDLYEQFHWPSIFNGDHKWTFSLGKTASWSPRSVEVNSLFRTLSGGEVISVHLQDAGYDRHLLATKDHRQLPVLATRSLIHARRIPVVGPYLQMRLFRTYHRYGFAVDQTLGDALAQIQVIVRKTR